MQLVTLPMRTDQDLALVSDQDALQSQKDYWQEDVGYTITPRHADTLTRTVETLVACYDEAMDRVVKSEELLRSFYLAPNPEINRIWQDMAVRSWNDPQQRSYLLDRFDLADDGGDHPVLLERNFGLMGLITGNVVQKEYTNWLGTQPGYEGVDAFGDFQGGFVDALQAVMADREIRNSNIALLMYPKRGYGDAGVLYSAQILEHWIAAAGFQPTLIPTQNVECGLMGLPIVTAEAELNEEQQNAFEAKYKIVGLVHSAITSRILVTHGALFPFYAEPLYLLNFAKLCITQPETPQILPPNILTPAWTMLAKNKRMLPILHEMFPDNPHILPAVQGSGGINGRKSIIKYANGVQGDNAKIMDAEGTVIEHNGAPPGEGRKTRKPENFISQLFSDAVKDSTGGYKAVHVFTANRRAAAAGVRRSERVFVGGKQTKLVPLIIR